MTLGPMQLVVLGFTGGEPRGEILGELERLAERDVVRLVDLLAVRRDERGDVQVLELERLPGGEGVLGELTGLTSEPAGAEEAQLHAEALDEDVWYVADAIPPGTAAAVALIEHRWAIPLREKMEGLGGRLLAEAWVDPLDLELAGMKASAQAPT
ncbi:DUF6325 family protein [Conexibacter arvalis]|uniref:DUF1269 domain-containing protein n=1 Tax=Conexibacter arvalis TaxID=912552 RepID=A0A840IL21_9ACTN|nr:DUF6325 family protein [Conexibacter arvalis]MBB4665025.1 hypothetical protein [Conexibacter arvalis]